MNKRQKEIQKIYLKNEKRILEDLKKVFENALNDIDAKIAALLARTDKENLQSIIYQVDYQKALRKQISGILDVMNAEQFTSVSEYLALCYEDGYIGTMYDIAGQGIPLIFPIDQEQVTNALIHDSKLSTKLYNKLGENVAVLKKQVAAEISRGIAQGFSYSQMAKNIRGQGKIALNQTMRIARTEGHRIMTAATFDAQQKAKSAGASIVKQWDSTLDKRTRPSHQRVDGEIRELDEAFSNGLMYPGDSGGGASEVVNCRCALLQRATWALDGGELKELERRAKYFGLDKTKNFEEYKQKYMGVIKRDND